jgi:cysteine desulfurase
LTLYLDYNATTPVHPEVLEEMITVYKEHFGNAGSRTHRFGQDASQIVEQARRRVASLLGVEKHEVVFTSGATEADNIAILGLARWGAEQGRRHIISTQIEHKAILEPLQHLEKQGFEIELVPVGQSGRIDAGDLLRRVRPDTLMVSVMHANNETGVIQPVDEIGAALSATPTFFHVDAAQTVGKLVPDLRALKYDLLSVSAHKIYGPQGVGALIRRKKFRHVPVQPVSFGGGQEGGLRPGTVPVALVAGLGKAAELADRHHGEWRKHSAGVKASILEQLTAVRHVVNGDLDYSLPSCLNVSFPGVDSEALMLATQNELAISNGSACTSAEYRPSHVLVAMGLAKEFVEGAVRISWGSEILVVDLRQLVQFVKNVQ